MPSTTSALLSGDDGEEPEHDSALKFIGWVLLIVVASFVLLMLFGSGVLAGSDWRSFFPDLLVGLATGLAVGLVLNFVQKRRLRAAMTYDWSSARGVLLDFVSTRSFEPDLYDLGVVGSISEFGPFVERYPIGQWGRELRTSEITVVTELVRMLDSLRTIGSFITKQSKQSARIHGMDAVVCQIAAAQLIGVGKEYFIAQGLTEDEYKKFLKLAKVLLEIGPLSSAWQTYVARRANAFKLVEALRNSLKLPWPS